MADIYKVERTFSSRFPIYTCKECKKKTRITQEVWTDAQDENMCVACYQIDLALAYEHGIYQDEDAEHPNQDKCWLC